MQSELLEHRREQIFPKLTTAQIARLEPHGKRVTTRAGEVLREPGQRTNGIFVVISGQIEVLVQGAGGEDLLYLLGPGDFNGEMSTLRGSVGFVRIRVREPGAVIAIETDELRKLVQTDAELSEVFMRAFILRRVALLSAGTAEVMLLGSQHSADTLRLREFLTRNAFPYVNIDVDTDPDVRSLFERFHVRVEDIPVVICHGQRIFRNPTNHELAECLGMNPVVDDTTVHDVVIVGAGPAGLAAAVYAASEGLDVHVFETMAPGGQAGTSSKIENYLGFPTGISGQALAGRALSQAQKFGASLTVAAEVRRLNCDARPYSLELADGTRIRASLLLIATGARYRLPEIENLQRYMGNGIYYAATNLESMLCRGEEVIVVGGGNSAGQAAVFLAASSHHVHILVRGAGLAESMSRYLIRRIEESPNITLHTGTELVALEGEDGLQRVCWVRGGEREWHDIRHVFLMTGASPNTAWLDSCLTLDDRGFVKTGPDLSSEDLAAARWPLRRAPYLLESSIPGVFAAGDVRSSSIKRIASAVGEGSMSVQFMHLALRELSVPSRQRCRKSA
jgi:thioredoxin reductase (NADPH)